jgi:hypothetical protein
MQKYCKKDLCAENCSQNRYGREARYRGESQVGHHTGGSAGDPGRDSDLRYRWSSRKGKHTHCPGCFSKLFFGRKCSVLNQSGLYLGSSLRKADRMFQKYPEIFV